MRRLLLFVLVLLTPAIIRPGLGAATEPFRENAPVNHDLKVFLDPESRRFTARDTVTVPVGRGRSFHFLLHAGLKPVSRSPNVTVIRQSRIQGVVPLESYRVTLPEGITAFDLEFGGEIYHPVSPSAKEPARGMRDSPGVISGEGVYLSGDAHWLPQFDETFVTFDLEVNLPRHWDAVSQGERTLHELEDGSTRVRWRCLHPQEQIFLVAGKYSEFSRPVGRIQAMVFLREQDKDLAATYLEAAGRYLEMYETMIGQYPYEKFALVENFWETGYGMPSFTLMGPKVIRFPFIVDSSYPHEILHNWWGNGVFPDPKSGNWSEGLTAYLADHLIREQRGTATQYRRDTLQKYLDYVSRDKDFPLTGFRSRHSSATEAVGYGKGLMFFHMLRMELGDDVFLKGLTDFYCSHEFKFASFDDIRKSLEKVSAKDLSGTFAQWVDEPGAPQLKISNAKVRPEGGEYLLTLLLEQIQPGRPYRLNVPVAITMKGREHAFQTVVEMTNKIHEAEFRLPHVPERIDVDPEFDLFRRLAPEEIPPALTQALGAKRLTIVIPSEASEALIGAFQEMARSLGESGPDKVTVIRDSDTSTIPPDTSVVILGWQSQFLSDILSELSTYGVRADCNSLTIGNDTLPKVGHSFVMTVRHPQDNSLSLTWIATSLVEAVPRLARKLPHYHGYSYLVFKGDEAENVSKGYWPVLDSPMSVLVPGANGSVEAVEMGKLKRRKPLASLP